MRDVLRAALPWLRFGGYVLIVAVLHWGEVVIVPVALAILLAFVLAPIVTLLQQHIGRVPAVLVTVALTFSAIGLAGWGLTSQVNSLAQELPEYQQNIRQKIRDVRWLGRGGSVEKLQNTVADIQHEIQKETNPRPSARPLVVQASEATGLAQLPTTLGAWLESFATAGLVVVLVVFMLLERQELRNRLISLLGNVALTTRALDEAGRRVSSYLFTQSLINLGFGVGVGIGLSCIGLPYVLLWACLAAALRFIPYIGATISAAAPLLVSLAVFADWTHPLFVLGLFFGLELLMYMVVEPVFLAGAAGISAVGLIVAVAFWTWLWGPLGLLMATPLTVCVAVMGKYVRGAQFLSVLIADQPVLEPAVSFYQRLLAGDLAEAADLVEGYARDNSADGVYDALILPALGYAQRDRAEGRLEPEQESAILEAVTELIEERAPVVDTKEPGPATAAASSDGARLAVLGWPASSEADVAALHMLRQTLAASPVALEVLGGATLVSDVLARAREIDVRVVFVADLQPGPPSRARYLVKRLRAAAPDIKVIVGRWAAASPTGEDAAALIAAGAERVVNTLTDSRTELWRLLNVPIPDVGPPDTTQAA
jgi:predicted PurR-regulated permease PerM